MFRIDVLQNQWLILALGGGAATLLSVILLFVALWRPRQAELPGDATERLSFIGWLRAYMPWVVIVLALGTAAFMAAYVVRAMRRPPNW